MAKDDIVDADGGAPTSDNFVTALVVFTTIALIAGWVIINLAHGKTYLVGPFK
jgi:hypothetical protein